MALTVVSLFSGCGGLDWGFLHKDTHLVYACDNDPAAIKCFNQNFNHKATLRSVQEPEFLEDLHKIGVADIVLGGFPCQGFSKSGPKKKDDPRNQLYASMVEAVRILQPKVFVAENVDGMAQNYEGQYVTKIIEDFSRLGYEVEPRILNAADFGVPQYRRRIIFIGIHKKLNSQNFSWPIATHKSQARNGEFKSKMIHNGQPTLFKQISNPLRSPVTIKEAIGDILEISESIPDHQFITPSKEQKIIIERIGVGQKLCNVRFASTSVYTWQIPEVFGAVTKREILLLEIIGKNRRKKKYGDIPNGNPLSIATVNELSGEDFQQQEFNDLESKGYLKEKDGKYDLKGAMFCSGLFKRPEWNEPSPTIITVFHSPRYFIHPIKPRPFTIREVARLQSFPDNFQFLSAGIDKQDAYRLIGNAVPPLLAKHIAESILTFLKKEYSHETSERQSEPRRNVQRV